MSLIQKIIQTLRDSGLLDTLLPKKGGKTLSFEPTTGDKISLYDDRIGQSSMYGFGVESSFLYSKSGMGHRWYIGANADLGASEKMSLDASGLEVAALRLTSGVDASFSSTDHGFQIGPTNGDNIIMDTNEILARKNGAPSTLYLQQDGGEVRINAQLAWHAGNLDPTDYGPENVVVGGSNLNEAVLKHIAFNGSGLVGAPTPTGVYDYLATTHKGGNTASHAFAFDHSTTTVNSQIGVAYGPTADVLAREWTWFKLWNESNDGSGSGLDADLLDSLHASAFWRRDGVNAYDIRFAATTGQGVRFYDSDLYKIYMAPGGDVDWGGRLDANSDYNMYFRMGSGTNRGWVFRSGTTPVAQIDSTGKLYAQSADFYKGITVKTTGADPASLHLIATSNVADSTLTFQETGNYGFRWRYRATGDNMLVLESFENADPLPVLSVSRSNQIVTFQKDVHLHNEAGSNGLRLTGKGNNSIELGRTDGVASTPYFDFHSGASPVDYDARFIATGGNGFAGGGGLQLVAADFTTTGKISPHNLSEWFLGESGEGGPLINVDTNDYMLYDRANNTYRFRIAGVDELTISPLGIVTDSVLAYQPAPVDPQFRINWKDGSYLIEHSTQGWAPESYSAVIHHQANTARASQLVVGSETIHGRRFHSSMPTDQPIAWWKAWTDKNFDPTTKADASLNNVTQTAARTKVGTGTMAYRNVTISSAAPSGGADGDFWVQVD